MASFAAPFSAYLSQLGFGNPTGIAAAGRWPDVTGDPGFTTANQYPGQAQGYPTLFDMQVEMPLASQFSGMPWWTSFEDRSLDPVEQMYLQGNPSFATAFQQFQQQLTRQFPAQANFANPFVWGGGQGVRNGASVARGPGQLSHVSAGYRPAFG